MKTIRILCALFISQAMLAQTTKYYTPALKRTFKDTSFTLLIKPKTAAVVCKQDTSVYERTTKAEVMNIKDTSLLQAVLAKLLTFPALENLSFNGCDLSLIRIDLSPLRNLSSLSVLNETDYDPDQLCVALKHNDRLKSLTLTTDIQGSVPDSLCLLKNLKNFSMMNGAKQAKKAGEHESILTYTTAPGVYNSITVRESGFPESQADAFAGQDGADKTYAFSNRFIRPPFKDVKINDSIYYFNSGSDRLLFYNSGTVLFVPKNIFVGANGKTYNGEVRLFYREFRNPVDIILSGIPMDNAEHGDTNLFRSAGMYELWAYGSKDEKLMLKEGKSINLNFKPTTDPRDYSFFTLDTSNGNWGSPKKPLSASSTNASSAALNGNSSGLPSLQQNRLTTAVRQFLTLRSRYETRAPDDTKYEERFGNANYLGFVNAQNYIYNADSTKMSLRRYDGFSRIKTAYKFRSIRYNKKKQLVFKFYERNNSSFQTRSARAMSEKVLLYDGDMTKSEFKKKYAQKVYTDFQLADRGSGLMLQLKSMKGYDQLPVRVATFDEKKEEYVARTDMEKNLNRRLKNSERSWARVYNRRHKHQRNNDAYDFLMANSRERANQLAYEDVRKLMIMTAAEKSLSQKQFIAKADTLQFSMMGNGGTMVMSTADLHLDSMVYNTNQVLINSGLGFNNIDAYIHKGMVEELYVEYNTSDGSGVSTDFATTIIPGINTSINNLKGIDEKKLSIRYIRDNPYLLLRIDPNGYIQVNSSKEFNKNANTVKLLLDKSIYVKDKSSREIAALIGVN